MSPHAAGVAHNARERRGDCQPISSLVQGPRKEIGEAVGILFPCGPRGPSVVDGEVTCPWRSDQSGEKHVATSPELHNKIIITSTQPPLFSFHLSFNQHSLFITLRGSVPFMTGCRVGSGGQACCPKLREGVRRTEGSEFLHFSVY